MNLKRKPKNGNIMLHTKMLIERRDELKGRCCRHVKTLRMYYIKDVGLGGCEIHLLGRHGPISHKTWEQFAKLYNLVPEDRGDAV